MNVIVPPSNSRICDVRFCGSGTIVVNPKSARHATGGVSLVIRMFAYGDVKK